MSISIYVYLIPAKRIFIVRKFTTAAAVDKTTDNYTTVKAFKRCRSVTGRTDQTTMGMCECAADTHPQRAQREQWRRRRLGRWMVVALVDWREGGVGGQINKCTIGYIVIVTHLRLQMQSLNVECEARNAGR